MKKLCFSTFATVLKLCKPKRVSQKKLCGTMLQSIVPTYDIREDDGAVSDLIRGIKNLSPIITENASKVEPKLISNYFKTHLIDMIDHNKKGIIVLALKDIITSDNSINPNTVIENVNNITKSQLMNQNTFVLEDFLAGILLYTLLYVENRNTNDAVKEITKEYIESFEDKKLDVDFINEYHTLPKETLRELEIDTRLLVLISESGGKCQKCRRPLALKKGENDINYAKVFQLTDTDEIVLCVGCEREIQSATAEDKSKLLKEKQNLETLSIANDATSRYTIEKEIEEVLRVVDLMDISEDTKLKNEPTKVKNKINEQRLKEKVLFNVRRLYRGVNDTLDRLSGENNLNVDTFAKNIKRMYEDASESHLSQSAIFNLLVDSLYEKTGRNYREACEIIISYFVQRCEVFDEITK